MEDNRYGYDEGAYESRQYEYVEDDYVEGEGPPDHYGGYVATEGTPTAQGRVKEYTHTEYRGGEYRDGDVGDLAEEDLPVSWIEYDVEYGPQYVEPPGEYGEEFIERREYREGRGHVEGRGVH